MVLFRLIRKIINAMKYVVLFFILLIGFAYFTKIRIPLPNGYILEGKYFGFGGDSDISSIISPNRNESVKNILDFYVQNQFVYGWFHPKKEGESRYFILNTATHQLYRYSSSKEYANALNSYSLKNGFISDSINILEIRSGFKKVYW
ncbi:unknown [Coraliomargarita sp. CAG:312]|nr:unknown [Coraliomargarita sp. CAG:312]